MKVFVPVSEGQIELMGLSPEDLVPFDSEYVVLRPGEMFADQPELADLEEARRLPSRSLIEILLL